ncbi:MAG: hypothetical protein IIC99_01720 [Chloroflexi bacterium]|nr:hypothetical protein [Chloroflexota bacterium]
MIEPVKSYITHIRDVALLPEERVSHIFCPETGLTGEPPGSGQVLVTTNQRILAFSIDDGGRQTFMASIEDLKGISVKTGSRTSAALLQGILLIVGTLFIYLVLAYWLEPRFQGPPIPVIRMNTGAFMVFVATLMGAFFIGRHYFAKEEGSVTFQGGNWAFSFPYKGEAPGYEIYQVINTVFADRRSRVEASRLPGATPPA